MTYTEIGQLDALVKWPDGTLDMPALAVVSCDRCGALVPATRKALHDASHA